MTAALMLAAATAGACLNGAASAAQRAPDAALAFVFPSVFFFPVTG
jgi:hypothetical protein